MDILQANGLHAFLFTAITYSRNLQKAHPYDNIRYEHAFSIQRL